MASDFLCYNNETLVGQDVGYIILAHRQHAGRMWWILARLIVLVAESATCSSFADPTPGGLLNG